jgi:hypothetical protein
LIEKRILRESNDLLEKLAREIARDFWIDISQAQELISENTGQSLEWFKNSLESNSSINISKLEEAIHAARKSISNLSIQSREDLKNTLLHSEFQPDTYNYAASKYLFKASTKRRALKPKSVYDQWIWLCIWIVDSSEALVLFSYWVWKWILMSPFHLYQLLTKKAKYVWTKKI